ncbi:MAG: superoxide dismutase family protein [Gammaproteobacteria bacterium]
MAQGQPERRNRWWMDRGLYSGKDGSAAAGHHYDPAATDNHEGPNGNGHGGDLPLLAVDERGSATSAAIAIRLEMEDLKGRSLMIHAGGDYKSIPRGLAAGTLAMGFPKGRGAALPFGRHHGVAYPAVAKSKLTSGPPEKGGGGGARIPCGVIA